MQTYKEFIQDIESEDNTTMLSSDSVSILLSHCNKTLLLKSEKWIVPNGFIEILEDPLTAVSRICYDQLGIDVERSRLTAVSTKLLDSGNKMYVYKYLCSKVESTNMIIDEDFLDSMWYTSSTVPESLPKIYKPFI